MHITFFQQLIIKCKYGIPFILYLYIFIYFTLCLFYLLSYLTWLWSKTKSEIYLFFTFICNHWKPDIIFLYPPPPPRPNSCFAYVLKVRRGVRHGHHPLPHCDKAGRVPYSPALPKRHARIHHSGRWSSHQRHLPGTAAAISPFRHTGAFLLLHNYKVDLWHVAGFHIGTICCICAGQIPGAGSERGAVCRRLSKLQHDRQNGRVQKRLCWWGEIYHGFFFQYFIYVY